MTLCGICLWHLLTVIPRLLCTYWKGLCHSSLTSAFALAWKIQQNFFFQLKYFDHTVEVFINSNYQCFQGDFGSGTLFSVMLTTTLLLSPQNFAHCWEWYSKEIAQSSASAMQTSLTLISPIQLTLIYLSSKEWCKMMKCTIWFSFLAVLMCSFHLT